MRKLLLTFCFAPLLFQVHAQVPGYLGKKLSLYYDASFWVGLHQSEDYLAYKETIHPQLNFHHNFSIDYVVSKSVAVGSSVKLVGAKIYNSEFSNPERNSNLFVGDVKLRGTLFSVYAKQFLTRRKGFVAPLGFYHQFEFYYGPGHAKTGKPNPYYSDPFSQSTIVSNFEDVDYDAAYHTYGFIYTVGSQVIYFDKLYIDAGASVALAPTTLLSTATIIGPYDSQSSAGFQEAARERFGASMIFSINLGVGFLVL